MTRLIEDWIVDIRENIEMMEVDLIEKTGMGYVELASKAAGKEFGRLAEELNDSRIAVVPVTTGLGIIGSFSEAVCEILRHMGSRPFITEGRDIDGIYEACSKDADVLFMADDDRFIAMNWKNGSFAENGEATALGFAAAAEAWWKGLEKKKILLAGYGNVGQEIHSILKREKADVHVLEIESNKDEIILKEGGLIAGIDEIGDYIYILDATSTGGWIKEGMLHEDARLVTPGVPLSLDEAASGIMGDRVLHDYLPIGVAVMAAKVTIS